MSKTFKYSRHLNFTIKQPDYVLLQSGEKLSIRFILFIVSKVCCCLAAGRRRNEGFSGERCCSEGICYDTCACFALQMTPQAPERLKPERNLKSGQEPIRPGRGEKENSPHTRSELCGFQEYLFMTGTFHRKGGSQSSFLFSGLDCLHAASTGCSLYIGLVNNTLSWTDNSQGSLHVGGLCAALYFL